MPALSLLPVAALFIATAKAATSFKNVVPYIPQVPHFHPPSCLFYGRC